MFLRLLYGAVLIAALALGWRLWTGYSALKDAHAAPLGNVLGEADAPLSLVVFMDYRCHYCREADAPLRAFLAERPEIKAVIRHYPTFGGPSVFETRLALAAGMQGKFEPMHDLLVARRKPVAEEEVAVLAAALGLDEETLRADMHGEAVEHYVAGTIKLWDRAGIEATPTYMAGNILYPGVPAVSDLQALIAEAYGGGGGTPP